MFMVLQNRHKFLLCLVYNQVWELAINQETCWPAKKCKLGEMAWSNIRSSSLDLRRPSWPGPEESPSRLVIVMVREVHG